MRCMQNICACHRPALPPRGVSQRGHVHSVFQRAINLRMEDGHLFTLSLPEDGRGPWSFTLNGSHLPGGLPIGAPVVLTWDMLRIGSLPLPIAEGAAYTLPRGRLSGTRDCFSSNLPLLRRRLEQTEREKNLGPFALTTQELLTQRLLSLKGALAVEDRQEAILAGQDLLGLGQGLTPSGDDMLTGLFLLLGLEGSPFPEGDRLLGQIIQGCVGETTDVSWQMLTAAASGYYKQTLVRFAQALGGPADELLPAMERVLSIGHSSGWDILLGCLTAGELLLKYDHRIGE